MKTQDAAYAALRDERFTRPRQFLRFTQPSVYGSATEFPFSVDFASADDIGAPTKTKRPWIMGISGNTQIVEPEFGRSDQGRFRIQLLDKSGELVKYFANPPLTLNGGIDAVVTTIPVNQDTTGYPALGTIEILTGGVRERARYLDRTLRSFIGCTRGVDGTSAASHSSADGVSNGEQIRRGTRVQLFLGYAELAEAQFMSFAKMEVVGRAGGQDRVSVVLTIADINRRPSRATVFLSASNTAPRVLAGNPITLGLAVLLSQGTFVTQTGTVAKTAGSDQLVGTGTTFTNYTAGDILRLDDGELVEVESVADTTHLTAVQTAILTGSGLAFREGGTNGRYDVLDAVDALGLPAAHVDVATHEALRASDFVAEQYWFTIIASANGKTFLEEQFHKTLNTYPVVNQTGQLSIKRYRVAVGVPTVTLDRDVIRAYDWLPADDQIINSVQFSYDFNVEGAPRQYGSLVEYLAGTPTDFTSSVGQVGRTQPLTITAMGWRSTLGAAALAAARAEQTTDRFAFSQTILMLDCHYLTHYLEVGDQVYVNDPRIPNIRTGQKGISNEVFEVLDVAVSFRPYQVRFTLLWVAAIPTVAVPTSQGLIYTLEGVTRVQGIQAAGAVIFHGATATASGVHQSIRGRTTAFAPAGSDQGLAIGGAGDRLEYDVWFDGDDPALTFGGVDLACIERQEITTGGAVASGITLNAAASSVDDFYVNMLIEILGNDTPAANGQIRLASDYDGAARGLTVSSNWTITPTGTIAYRIVRLLRVEGLTDQNGISSVPGTEIGGRALRRWYHRIIPFPAAWAGKHLISMMSGLQGWADSQSEAMLIANPRITTSDGDTRWLLARYTFASGDVVGSYGSEQNVTAVDLHREVA